MPAKGDKISLECEVLCANPKNITYNWCVEIECNDKMNTTRYSTSSSSLTDIFSYEVACEYKQIKVTCSVLNGVHDDAKETASYSFIFTPYTSTLPQTTTPIGLSKAPLVVIIVGGVVLLMFLSSLAFLLVIRKRTNSRKLNQYVFFQRMPRGMYFNHIF